MNKNISTSNTKEIQSFRIASKNLFLARGQRRQQNVILTQEIIHKELTENLNKRDIQILFVLEERYDDGYEHFHAAIILNKKADIRSQEFPVS